MKIISLNIWGGKLKEQLLKFLIENKKEIDVFCFQEVFSNHTGNTNNYINTSEADPNTLQTLQKALPDFKSYFCPVDEGRTYETVIFIKKDIEVANSGDVLIYENTNFNPEDEENDHNRKLQWLEIKDENKGLILLTNLHGTWSPSGKKDTPERLKQSQILVKFLESFKKRHEEIKFLIVGDFNLLPKTTSLEIIENMGLKNLIKENKIKSTRTSFFMGSEKFADYIFCSKDQKVKDFKVLPCEVSDHYPIYLEI